MPSLALSASPSHLPASGSPRPGLGQTGGELAGDNLRVAAALAEAGYDFRLVLATAAIAPTTVVSSSLTLSAGDGALQGVSARFAANIVTAMADEPL